jgi:hypothetical protein
MDATGLQLPLDTPTAFGNYAVSSYIGIGSYGYVYRVRQTEGLEYALKWLKPDADNEGRQRFENEIWALQQLDHPAIPKLIDQGEYLERPYYVMSLAKGSTLRSVHHEQLAQGGASAHMWVLTIVSTVLDALSHMHERGIFHRDVKDDNVIVTDDLDHISLVDLGFCRGVAQRPKGLSFWGVGAAKYSPLSKLRHPSSVHETHDVFAVGVLAYLLLTNLYPWDPLDEDVGKLKELMETKRVTPIHEINSLVPPEVWSLVAKLLLLDDDSRPRAAAARDESLALHARLATQGPYFSSGRALRYARVVRDPLWGDIRLTDDEWRILNTREFQRLRWIKQLGFSNLVYSGAEHSRMSHALGTVFVVERIIKNIEDRTGIRVDAEKRLLARSFALTHDIAHISFGHTLEDELSFYTRHDKNYDRFERLCLSADSEFGSLLKETSIGRQTLNQLNPLEKDKHSSEISELVEGSTGADVLDYIDRDSYFCGLDHRVDSALFRRYTLTDTLPGMASQPHLLSLIYGAHGIRLDAEFALETVLVERFALFLKIYTHPAKIAAGAMLGKAVYEAIRGRKPKFLESELERMGDIELLLRLRESGRTLCDDLASRLLNRRLFKAAFRARALKLDQINMTSYRSRLEQFESKNYLTPVGRRKAEIEIARKIAGVRSKDLIVYISPRAPGLQKVTHYIETAQGRRETYDEVHEPYDRIVKRHLRLWNVYVFVPDTMPQREFNAVGDIAQNYFMLSNEIEMNRRQGILGID